MNKEEKYPNYLSKEAKELLMLMLIKNPDKRIKIKDIKKHPFCSDLNWEKVLKKEVTPPIKVN